MAFSIRAASLEDADFVLSLFARPHVRSQLHAPTHQAFAQSLETPSLENLIVERDGARFGNLVLDKDPQWMLTVRSLAAWDPKRGAGRYAMEQAIARGFDALQVHRIFLEVLASNVVARRLYERLGFRAEGFYRDGFRDEGGHYHNLVPYGMLADDRRVR
ncbi:MAG TPA: GNAT family protein [Candidatus Acidoferrales bacterium]|nr:GNAT family protein [Candidatus Acidoferrales bacterium]